ncbi:MAG: hypothetical protein ACKOTE_01565 [Opitutaceae bacterium]
MKVLPFDESGLRKLNSLLTAGQSMTFNGVIVKHLAGEASTVNVEVTRP